MFSGQGAIVRPRGPINFGMFQFFPRQMIELVLIY